MTKNMEKLGILVRVGGIIIILILLSALVRNLLWVRGSDDLLDEAREEALRIEEENEKLEEALRIISSEDFVRRRAYEKLGLVASGEAVLVFPDERVLKSLTMRGEEPLDEEEFLRSNWEKWRDLVF